MNNVCYKCGVRLVSKMDAGTEQINKKQYTSEEHIIPRFCGGHLTSSQLLCLGCNNKLGTDLDCVLSDQLILPRLLKYKIDSGTQSNKKIKGITRESKKEILVNNQLGWQYFKPIEFKVSDKGEILHLRARNEKEARKFLLGQKRKYPHIDVDKALDSLQWKKEHLHEQIDFGHYFIGEKLAFRAICKIAINYYLYNHGNVNQIISPIQYVCLGDINGTFVQFYYPLHELHSLAADEVSHILYLKADPLKQLLYVYIELFNTHNFLVILNDSYDGPYLEATYCYDLIKADKIQKQINLNLFRNPMYSLFDTREEEKYFQHTQKIHMQKLDRIYRIIENINHKK